MELLYAGAAAQVDAMARGAVTSVELTRFALDRIERLNPALNAFRVVLEDEALTAAADADRRRAAGESAPLLGVPIAIKDDVEQRGQTTMFGTGAPDRESDADSEVLRRLRQAGAVVVGRTHAPELLMWPFTESVTWGATRNPWDLERTPGGSSGGSAAAVAAGLVGIALGSDGGGSIRGPAACCGLFGLKPTRDLISVAPHTDEDHAWQGLSVYGPLSRTVADAALFMDATAEDVDRGESTYADAASTPPPRLRIGVAMRPPLPAPVSAQVRGAVTSTAELLRSLGHTVVDVSPHYLPALPNFAVRYLTGIAASAADMPHHERFESRTRSMVRMGRAVAPRLGGLARRREPAVTARVMSVFEQVDVLLTPILTGPPARVGQWAGQGALRTFNGVSRWMPYAATWNVTGSPAAAVPAGLDTDGLPIGVQLVGRSGADRLLLSLSAEIEAARPWAESRPPDPATR